MCMYNKNMAINVHIGYRKFDRGAHYEVDNL